MLTCLNYNRRLQLIHSGAADGAFVTQSLVALPLAYICGCAYFSLFKMGIFGGFYHMVSPGAGLSVSQGQCTCMWSLPGVLLEAGRPPLEALLHPPPPTPPLQVSHATWAYSLLLNGSLLCRFAAPLCFNFLHVIRMNEYLYHGEVRWRGQGGSEGRVGQGTVPRCTALNAS